METKNSLELDCLDWRILSTETIAILKKNKKWVIVDFNNKKICDTEFDDIYKDNYSLELFTAKIDDYYGFIDKYGKTVIDFKYKYTGAFIHLLDCKFHYNKVFCPVTLDGKNWGLINHEGKEVIPYKYDWLERWCKKYLIVHKNGKTGIIDWNGKIIIDFIYDGIGGGVGLSENYIIFGLNEKYGFVRIDGKPLKIHQETSLRAELTIPQRLPNKPLKQRVKKTEVNTRKECKAIQLSLKLKL